MKDVKTKTSGILSKKNFTNSLEAYYVIPFSMQYCYKDQHSGNYLLSTSSVTYPQHMYK